MQSTNEKIQTSNNKLTRISSQLQLTRQQIEFYTQEFQRALEGIKDSNWRITKEMCTELRKIQSPSKSLAEVCEKVMLVLDQPEKSFQSFRNLTKNFGFLKDLMSSVQNQTFSEQVINELLPIWKNQTIIQAKLMKISKCACLLAQWLSFIVEYSLKKETVNSSKKREPELEKKIKTLTLTICDLGASATMLQEEIARIQRIIECRIEIENDEMSENFKVIPEGALKPRGFPVHRATASQGMLESSISSANSQAFPKFHDDMYAGTTVKRPGEILISFEGQSDVIGCGRLKFFCC